MTGERVSPPDGPEKSAGEVVAVDSIWPLLGIEASAVEQQELDHFMTMLRELPAEVWQTPVPNTRLTVHELVSVVAGALSAQRTYGNYVRQFDPRLIRAFRGPGESLGEVMQRIHIGKRIGHEPGDLIEEIALAAPFAVRTRAHWPIVRGTEVRRIPIVTSPLTSPFAAIRWLWFRRLQIGEAAKVGYGVQRGHDDRILELVLKAAAERGTPVASGAAIDLRVRELDDRTYRFGENMPPAASITIGLVTLAKLAARWRSPAGARERAEITGEVLTAMKLFRVIHGD
jgi:hypothetical protein